MASFLTIKTRVEGIVIDLPTFVTNNVEELINQAMRDLQDEHEFKVMERETAVLPTVVDTRVLAAVPDNFKRFRNFPYETVGLSNSDDGYRELLSTTSRDNILRQYGPADTGRPEIILDATPTDDEGTRSFEVWPLPDGANPLYTDGEYKITIPYWAYVTPLSADGETNWFTVNADWYLTFKAAANGFALDWDYTSMAVWEQKAQMQLAKAVKADKMYRLGDVTTFVPRKNVYDRKLSGRALTRWSETNAL